MQLCFCVVTVCVFAGALSLCAQQAGLEEAGIIRIPRVQRAPKLSDFLQSIPREAEAVVTDFRQYVPSEGGPVSQPTTAYLSYDAKNLYVAFVCADDPRLISARVAKHDQIMSDDRVIVNIDTFHDRRHMYWFDANPYGVQADGNVTDGLEDDPSWDTLWHSDGTITENGYVVLFSIPFRSLRFPNHAEQTWGLILGRYIQRNNECSLWPYVSSRKAGWAQQGGDLVGLRDISPGRNIQLIPYGIAAASRYLETSGGSPPEFVSGTDFRGGLDAKVVLKGTLTADLALNPDFSQVESDEPQVTVNQRYEVYFPEKRPFFLENAGLFLAVDRLFFSRRIADPNYGARLTGKLGNWSVGALVAGDRAPGEGHQADDPLDGKHAAAGVFRLLREFRQGGRTSTFGAMLTSRDFGPSYNRVYSFDTRLRLLPNWTLAGQVTGSRTRMLEGRILAGPAYRIGWYHSGRNLISTTQYIDRSPNFRAELGYVPRLDIREVAHNGGYIWRPETGLVQNFGPVVDAYIIYDREGRLRDWKVTPEFRLGLIRATSLSVTRDEVFELYDNHRFRYRATGFTFSSQWFRWLWLDGSFSRGTGVNYYPSAGKDPFLGRRLQASGGITIRPEPHVQIEGTYIFNRLLTGPESGASGAAPGAAVFLNHIARSKLNWQFSRRLSARFIADCSFVLPNASLSRLERSKTLTLDALFTYMLNPGTALHIGYTDIYDNYRIDPTASPGLIRTPGLDLNTGRQAFMKLSYLLRF
jgi:hypothetical protein